MATKYVEADYTPRPQQIGMHDGMESHRWSVIVAHRRFGKTVCVINHLIKMASMCRLQRPKYAYLAPTYAQAKKVAWEYLKHYTSRIPGCKTNESEMWISLPNQAKIMLAGADNPDSLRGIYLDGCVLDEVAQMKPHAWKEVIRPTLSDRKGWAVFIGTPKGVNMFYDIWLDAQDDHRWYSDMFKVSDTKLVDQEDLDAALKTMGEAQYRQEYECDWTANNADVVMDYAEVSDAFARSYHIDVYRHRPVVFGVDPARFGDDRSALVVRQGLAVLKVETWKGLDLMATADYIQRQARAYKPEGIFVDSVGVGAGVVDRLRQLGHDIIAVNGGSVASDPARYADKRAEMWFRCKAWLQSGGALPESNELKSDLLAPTYFFDNKNRMRLERKEDMKKRGINSPDVADALCLTFAHEVHATRWEGGYEVTASTEYDYFSEGDSDEKVHDMWYGPQR